MDSDGKILARYEKLDAEGKPDSLAEWTEFHVQVEKLPEEEREVFGVLWYGGLSQKEAVAALGISERTLRRRWRSARVLLYEAMKGAQPSD
jgi:RNA polymerase sigma-70 factor (ECF subfamily)